MTAIEDVVDYEHRSVRASVFTDRALFDLEQNRVFGRSWLYVAHRSQLENPGDFVTANMGRDPVVVCRGKDQQLRVFLNSCPHKGARYCREDRGNTKSFVCPYHVRTFDTAGTLIGIAGAKLADLDVVHAGLIEVPRVETFEGLVFASFDANIIPLEDYLGDMKWYLEVILAQAGTERTIFEGIHRWTFDANWKFPAEQFTGDPSHQYGVHRSMGQLGFDVNFGDKQQDFVARFDNGHGLLNMAPRNRILMTRFQRDLIESARQRLTEDQAELLRCLYIGTVFPNFSIVSYPGFLSVRVWQPVAPDKTEIWSSGLVPSHAPDNVAVNSKRLLSRYFSPTGMLEQDDLEVWEECHRGVAGAQRNGKPVSYALPKRPVEALAHLPGDLSAIPSEHANFGFFSRWHELMRSEA
ncbi:MAG: SRPBCC family protein [Deltaproteobacteria bacterium]|jgi:3-phenylpropionate/trans-cinnamate dioxygenase alpha subunit